jgi:hypothetical protein
MEDQKSIDYWRMFTDLMQRRSVLVRQRDEAEVELAKMKQTIVSVFAMLTKDQQGANQQAIDDIEAESAGIQDAIKTVFSMHSGEWLSVSKVRDHLDESGFDFRRYKANVLASIGTTLRRLADTGYLEVKNAGAAVATATLYMRNDPTTRLNNAIAERVRALEEKTANVRRRG